MATANKKTIQLRCAACGGTLETEEDSPVLTCPYCGAKEMIIESDAVKKERIRAKAYKEVELERIKHDEELEDKREEKQQIAKFRKSFMRKLLIGLLVIFFIAALGAFSSGAPLAGLVALVQAGLVGAALLLGNGTIKTKVPNLRQVLQTVALLLIIVFLLIVGMNGGVDHNEKLYWPESGLSSMLPVPDSEYGHVYRDSTEEFDCDVYHYSESQFSEYKLACSAMGFDQEQTSSHTSWTAFNSAGDKLELYYYDSYKEMGITLTAAKPMSALRWPTTRVGQLVPEPKSKVGYVDWETDSGFVIYVGDTPKDEYDAYVSECIDRGFDVKYSRGTDYFYADNKEGYHLSVSYYGNNIMIVRADEPYDFEEPVEQTEETEEPAPDDTEETTETTEPAEVSPEFKATMDDYEAFVDDYVEFMAKYENAEDTSTMSEEYSAFIDKFANIMNELNSIDPTSLSNSDYAYYQQVLTRIFVKLAALGI